MRETSSIGFGGVGVVLGVVATGILIYINCAQYPDPFCSVGPAIFFGPFIVLIGLTVGLVLGYMRKRERTKDKERKSSYRGYGYALLGTVWITLIYVWFTVGEKTEGYGVLSWKVIAMVAFILLMFLAWFLKRRNKV